MLHVIFMTVYSYVLMCAPKLHVWCWCHVLQVNYSKDQQKMKGRPSVILDTPELRHVKETQNNISMVEYILHMARMF